jgi:hypothetical protein
MNDAKRDKQDKSVLEDKEKFGADNADERLAHMGDKPGARRESGSPQPEKK